MRVASVQFCHQPGDKSYNLQRIAHFVRRAAEQEVQLICFPECCISGYWHLRNLDRQQLAELAEPIPLGPSVEQLQQLASKYKMVIGAGLVEQGDDGQLFNAYPVVMPDGTIWNHRKLHCFVSPHMQSGHQYTVYPLPDGRIAATLICYDNNLVENVRICALRGAQVILAPHQTGGCNSGSPQAMGVIDRRLWDNRQTNPQSIEAAFQGDKGRGWLMRWLPSRAHDNGLFYIFSNGVGPDDNEVRTGNAMILDPYGRILVETSRAGDDMVVSGLDWTVRERCTGVRWMRARRPELYGELTRPIGIEQDTRAVRFDHLNKPDVADK